MAASEKNVTLAGQTATIALTPEQKKTLAEALNVHWDELTIGRPTLNARASTEGDLNVVVAMGQTATIS